MKNFEVINCKLYGSHLIEASAGTGKTFLLTRIFLRLILEGYDISKILIVSFTLATTKELRERIRHLLQDALAELRKEKEEKSINEIIESFIKKGQSIASLDKIIQNALSNFDKINIGTIHSFCSQLLEENLFSSDVLPLPMKEIITNDNDLSRELILDYWWTKIDKEAIEFIDFLSKYNFSVSKWIEAFDNQLVPEQWQLPIKLDKKMNKELLEKYITKAKKAFMQLQDRWHKLEKEKNEYFTFLKQRSSVQSGTIKKLMVPLNDYFQKKNVARMPLLSLETEALLTKVSNIKEKNKNKIMLIRSSSQQEFISLWENYRTKYEELIFALRDRSIFLFLELKETYTSKLNQKKYKKQLISYQDMLSRTHHALIKSAIAKDLLKCLHKKYSFALIDEFQDTDRIQSDIFRKIFDHKHKGLFLIGDPKQSIYAFRASDLNVYLEWKRRLKSPYALKKNYRSSPRLLAGINAIYQSHTNQAFNNEDLEYISTEAARKENDSQSNSLRLEWKQIKQSPHDLASQQAPLHFIIENLSPEENHIKKKTNTKKQEILELISYEITKLLNLATKEKVYYGPRPLRASDIAILVRKKQEALEMRDILINKNIPAILSVEENVFNSKEAKELSCILQAIFDKGRKNSLKEALSTEIWGYTSKDIYKLFESNSESENNLAQLLMRISKYATLWEKNGFMAMFKAWLVGEKIASSILSRHVGERKLNNLLQLSDLVHLNKDSDAQSVLFFIEKEIELARHQTKNENTNTKLSLESDRDAVQIMTIHASKGLEFPIVFSPCLLKSTNNSIVAKKNIQYYDKDKKSHILIPSFLQKFLKKEIGQHKLSKGLSPNVIDGLDFEVLTEYYKDEVISEELRLLYVAITRAKERLYIYLSSNKDNDNYSASSYLFSGSGFDFEIKTVSKANNTNIIHDAIINNLCQLMHKNPESIFVEKMSKEEMLTKISSKVMLEKSKEELREKKEKLSARIFDREINPSISIYSFSSIMNQKKKQDTRLYENEITEELIKSESTNNIKTIFNFYKGAKSGNFFHNILEHIDFKNAKNNSKELQEIIALNLEKYDYDKNWQDFLINYVMKILRKPIIKGQDFCLGDLSSDSYTRELGFYFDLDFLKTQKTISNYTTDSTIKPILADFEKLWPLDQTDTKETIPHRFMRGYIDLIFRHQEKYYILDWKSHYLGNSLDDYNNDKITENIENSGYRLQYYLYIDALHRKFKLHKLDYEKNFGGVYYIYLRGLNEDLMTGIFFTRPSLKELENFQVLYQRN